MAPSRVCVPSGERRPDGAVNVAIGLASRSTVTSAQQWSYPAAIIDADLQFGDQALMLGLDPTCSLALLTSPAPGMVVHPNLTGDIGSGGQSVGTTHMGILDLVIPTIEAAWGCLVPRWIPPWPTPYRPVW